MKQILFEIKFHFKETIKFILKIPKMVKKTKTIIKEIDKIDDKQNNIFYFGSPIHPNLGDQAQSLCIKKWLNTNYKKSKIIEFNDDVFSFDLLSVINKLKSKVKDSDLIVFQSGYCTTDKYYISERMHRNIIKKFPNNKILFFPQTIKFYSIIEEKRTAKIYNQHKNIIFLARDKTSYELAKKMFTFSKIYLYPDIVTSMIGENHYNEERNGILFCMRNDREQFYGQNEINTMINTIEQKYKIKINKVDTTIDEDAEVVRKNIKNILEKTFSDFSKYKLIITDRYHGTIFSLISETPVIVLGSTDHKLESGVDWFKNVYKNRIFFAKNLNDLKELIKKIYEKEFEYIKYDDYFQREYYSKLKEKVEE